MLMHSILIIGQSNMGGRGFKDEVEPIKNEHLFVLRDVKIRPPGGLIEDVVDAVEAEGDLPCLMEPGQILCPETGAVANEKTAAARVPVLPAGYGFSVAGLMKMGLHPGLDDPGPDDIKEIVQTLTS